MVGLLGLGQLGCAAPTGWTRTEARTCERDAPAQVCSFVRPDHGHTIQVGDQTIVPGECVVAPEGGGRIQVITRDPRGHERDHWVRAPKGRVTIVAVDDEGELPVTVRHRCDRSPIVLD